MAYDAGCKVDPIKQLKEVEQLVADLLNKVTAKELYWQRFKIQKLKKEIHSLNAFCFQCPKVNKET